MKRVPEVCDVWFDSGAMPFAQMNFPFAQVQSSKFKVQNYNELVKQIPFPADFICEAVDQTRGWFYTLLAVSTLLGLEAPYRNVISLGHILDKHGKKMSKKNRNYSDPMALADRYGIDALRWYFFVVNSAGEPKRFDEKDVLDAQRKSVMVLLNVLQFLNSYADVRKPLRVPARTMHVLDRWVMSRFHHTAAAAAEALDRYDTLASSRAIGEFLDDLTNWYVRRSRERFQLRERTADFNAATGTLRLVFEETVKLAAPFVPFVAEHIWRSLKKKESVHQEAYPAADKRRIDKPLEYDMMQAREAVSAALKKRAAAGVKVRQPLRLLKVKAALRPELLALLKDEVNVKEAVTDSALSEEVWLDTLLTPELREEGDARELIRHVQAARKEAGLTQRHRVALAYKAEGEAVRAMEKWKAHIQERVGAKRIERLQEGDMKRAREVALERGKVWFVIKRAR